MRYAIAGLLIVLLVGTLLVDLIPKVEALATSLRHAGPDASITPVSTHGVATNPAPEDPQPLTPPATVRNE